LIFWIYATPNIMAYFGEIPALPKGIPLLLALFGIILAVELIIGTALALMGSSLALSRARKAR
jgi:hypothetical protein